MSAALQSNTAATPPPTRIGQGTAVEQSRAVAQVQAAMLIAQQYPRNVFAALAEMRQACNLTRLAEQAFYSYPKGGQQVVGPTVHLARELARIWGNLDYGLVEMLRDDTHGQSELQAFAWDLQTNTRNSSTFILPHRRAGAGAKLLTDIQDIYENNANNGARRVREAIFAVLPRAFVDEAQELCHKTLADGGGIPLPDRVTKAVEAFATLAVTVEQLERRLGSPMAQWKPIDLAQLTILFASIRRGETRAAEEFAAPPVSTAEILNARPVPGTPTAKGDRFHGTDDDFDPADVPDGPDVSHPQDCDCPVCVHFGITPGPDGSPTPAHGFDQVPGCPVCQDIASRAAHADASPMPTHAGHAEDEYGPDCPGCQAESAAMDQENAK